MLSEFDGIRSSSSSARVRGSAPEIDILDVETMVSLRDHFSELDWDEVYAPFGLRKIVFVCQWNNFADNWGLCVEDFQSFSAGSVVYFDRELSEPDTGYPSLFDFIARGPRG